MNLLVWIACLTAPSYAASTTGQIKGVVVDEACWGIAGARLTLQGPAGGPQVVTTGDGGGFRFEEVPPGSYELLTEMLGFGPVRSTGLEVEAGLLRTTIVRMRAGGIPVEVVGWDADPTMCPGLRSPAPFDPELMCPFPTGRQYPAAGGEGQATPSAVAPPSSAPAPAPVRYKIAIGSAHAILQAELSCGGWHGSRAVVGDDIVVEFYPPPGMCTLTVHGTQSLSTDVTVPADGGDVVCFASKRALSCLGADQGPDPHGPWARPARAPAPTNVSPTCPSAARGPQISPF